MTNERCVVVADFNESEVVRKRAIARSYHLPCLPSRLDLRSTERFPNTTVTSSERKMSPATVQIG